MELNDLKIGTRVECTGDCDNGITTGCIIESSLNNEYGCIVKFDDGEEEWIDYDQLAKEIIF